MLTFKKVVKSAKTTVSTYIHLLVVIKKNSLFSELYWIFGAVEKSIVRGSWARNAPQVLISAANLYYPRSLQYDVTSQRLTCLMRNFLCINICFNNYRIGCYLAGNGMLFHFRLYWLEHTFIKSSRTNGSGIKSHINTNGAKKIFAYKVF